MRFFNSISAKTTFLLFSIRVGNSVLSRLQISYTIKKRRQQQIGLVIKMSEVYYNTINMGEEGQRLDNYLIRILKGVPKSHIYRIIRSGEVRVNKKRAQVSTRLSCNDRVRIPPVRVSAEKETHVGKSFEKELKDCVIFESKELLVVNKPTGIAVHGGSGLSLGMIEAFRKIRHDLVYLELVHRLDKETSGCLLFAKKRSILRAIQDLLARRAVIKTYWALLSGPWSGPKSRWVDVALIKNTLKSGERMVTIAEDGKPSLTHFKLLENYPDACLVEVTPKTGRTHQIRVHSVFLNHPIIGDPKYGNATLPSNIEVGKKRLYLHARSFEFTLEGVKHRYEAPLDACFAETLEQLKRK